MGRKIMKGNERKRNTLGMKDKNAIKSKKRR